MCTLLVEITYISPNKKHFNFLRVFTIRKQYILVLKTLYIVNHLSSASLATLLTLGRFASLTCRRASSLSTHALAWQQTFPSLACNQPFRRFSLLAVAARLLDTIRPCLTFRSLLSPPVVLYAVPYHTLAQNKLVLRTFYQQWYIPSACF